MTKREAVKRLLADGGWVKHLALRRVGGTRFSARLYELRRLGFDHETRWRSGGTEYRWAR